MANGELKGAIKPFLFGFAATVAVMLLRGGADTGGTAPVAGAPAGKSQAGMSFADAERRIGSSQER
jgi:hypothetical protein